MHITSFVARPLLAGMFVYGGLDAFRNPAGKVPRAEKVAPDIADAVGIDADTEQLVQFNGAVQVAAGVTLALGIFPRLSALALAGTLIPTTLAGHRFWEIQDDPGKRAQQKIHFFKNLGMLGGLMLAAVDTEGRPGLAWRAQHAGHHVVDTSRHARKLARLEARLVARSARDRLPG